MNTDSRRSKRYNEFISVSVLARNEKKWAREAGPYGGRIINISRHGACIIMPLGVLGPYEVYRSTFMNEELQLKIQGDIIPGKHFILAGTPAWMSPFVLDDLHALKMGVEFTSKTISTETGGIIENLEAAQQEDTPEDAGLK